MGKKRKQDERFEMLISELRDSEVVQKMENYIQHGKTTTLQHSKDVARLCYDINRVLHLNADERQLIRSAMLHDLFLYDWHDGDPVRKTHGFDHPEIACRNAIRFFNISEKEQEAIRSHMWPLTIRKIPSSREAVLLCIADKCCSLRETIHRL